jgi:hypothetical protein
MNKFVSLIAGLALMALSLHAFQESRPVKPSAAGLIEKSIRRSGLEAAKREFQKMKADRAAFAFDEEGWDDLGCALLAEKSIGEAVAVFEMAAELFPESGNSFASLADAYLFAADKAKAEANYRLALAKDAWGAKRIQVRLDHLEAQIQAAQAALKAMVKPGRPTGLNTPYLDPRLPGNKPQLFAPGLVSLIGWSFWCTFSPDGKEFYFTRGNKKKIIMVSRREEGGWTAPVPASFTAGRSANEPHVTADNRRIIFGMGGETEAAPNLYFAERIKTGWSDSKPFGRGMHVTSSQDGRIILTDISRAGQGIMTLAQAVLKDGRIESLDPLQGGIAKARESLKRLAHPCLSPDGSYLLFDNGRGLLHISFREVSGEWGEAIDLTKRGFDPNANSATISPDGRCLFLDLYGDLHWMSTDFIEELRFEYLKPKGDYLGQARPGSEPRLFAPGIVSTEAYEHGSAVFSKDLTEIYWTRNIEENGRPITRRILMMASREGLWDRPQIPDFTKFFAFCEDPFITPDGKKLFFSASRSVKSPNPALDKKDIYFVERTGAGWSAPIPLAKTINLPESDLIGPTVSGKGTLFYSRYDRADSSEKGFFHSAYKNGEYSPPHFLGDQFLKSRSNYTAYIASDESYFIFASLRAGGRGSHDLFISFRRPDGTWGEVTALGDKINTEKNERFPNVTPDGKYLFFNRGGDVYWVETKAIEDLRPGRRP